jgi:hypothetical protein
MRLLNFALLVATLVGAYFAQYLFDHASLVSFFPDRLLNLFPQLSRLTRWQPEDLYSLALWIAILSSLVFGLIAPMWKNSAGQRTLRRLSVLQQSARRWRTIAAACLVLATTAGAYLLAQGWTSPLDGSLAGGVWLAGGAAVIVAAIFLDKARPVRIVYLQPGQPERGWWQLLIVLAIGVWLFTWNNGSLPRRIPAQSAQLALQAQAQAEGNLSIFAYGEANLPGISSLPTAITIWLTGDPLRSIAWTGSVAAALTVLATWLLACELFRRRSTWQTDRSTHDTSNDNLEDDGHSPALWAALALVVSVPMIHFSRLPGQLEPLVCGLFALWSLLLGLRLGRLWVIALSGILAGCTLLTASAETSGAAFVATCAFLWVGVWLLKRAWISPRLSGVGVAGALFWFGSLLFIVTPLLGEWVRRPELLIVVTPDFLSRLRPTLLAFTEVSDVNSLVDLPLHLLNSLLAPLFVLAIGALLFNLDHLSGWVLATWLAFTICLAAFGASNTSVWPALLPALPAAALAIAFVIDRTRAATALAFGGWSGQAVGYLALGLLTLTGISSLTSYTEAADAQRDLITTVARAAHSTDETTTLYLYTGAEDGAPIWNEPAIRLVTQAHVQAGTLLASLDPADLPPVLAPGALVLITPDQRAGTQLLAERYPGGTVRTVRDRHANPILYIYAMPQETQ